MAEMKIPEMKTLTIGGTTYEIVDELARETLGNLEIDEAKVKEIVEDCLDAAGVEKFATKDEVNVKADDVLFPDDFRTGAAVGGFGGGESLQGMTLRAIIAKLLNAELYVSITEKIMKDKIPMLSGSTAGLEKTTYSYITMTPAQAAAAPTTSAFYQIADGGSIRESGYQLFTEATGRTNFAIALPERAKIVSVSMWEELTQSWVPYSPVFAETGKTTVDGVVYTTYESDDSSSGEVLRIAIE